MIEMEKLATSKEKILSTIRSRGPALPVQVAKAINFSPLFAGAFLSELKGEGKLKMSNLRVGSSPLYYLPGQEAQLEKFVPYLNEREKEAFQKLKKEGVLEDAGQDPVIRVALRAIKDFAVPVKVRVNGEQKLVWKHFSLNDDEIMDALGGPKKAPEPEKLVEPVGKKEEVTEAGKEAVEEQGLLEKKAEVKQQTLLEEDERPLAEKKKEKVVDNEFAINVKDFLSRKDIEVLHVVAEKKKEFEAKIRINTDLGRQTYYLIAKDKKSVSDSDLLKAEKKARGERLPAVFMSQGDLNKKGRQHLEAWGNLVRFEKLDL
ncbi:MAG: hypothetical protein ABH864_02740 [archaeon]